MVSNLDYFDWVPRIVIRIDFPSPSLLLLDLLLFHMHIDTRQVLLLGFGGVKERARGDSVTTLNEWTADNNQNEGKKRKRASIATMQLGAPSSLIICVRLILTYPTAATLYCN